MTGSKAWMVKARQCPECDALVMLNKRYCPECHATVNPRAPEDPVVQIKEASAFGTVLLLSLASMALFFSFAFLLPAVLSEPGFILVSAVLFCIGIALVAGAWAVKIKAKRRIAALMKAMHVMCEYCGSVNDRDRHRCASCGAPLAEPPVNAVLK